jgi:1-acyl-sn-glycerol-3-phosphate acyltransferase
MDLRRVSSWVAECLLWPVRLADKCSRIDVVIPEDTRAALQAGQVMVFANHPSLIETFVLRHVLDTVTTQPVWSIADEKLFPKTWFEGFQCIPVSRVVGREALRVNIAACRAQDAILNQKGIVSVYPEGTRTCKTTQRVIKNGREVGVCHNGFLERAQKKGAVLIPVWIEHGRCDTPQGFVTGYCKLFVGSKISLTFGQPLSTQPTPECLAEALLSAGS